MNKILFGVILSLAAISADAAAFLKLSWTNPTQTVVGGPLTGVDALTKFQFFISPNPIPDSATPTVEIPANSPLQTTYQYPAQYGQTLYARMTACNSTGCSVKTNQVSALIPFPSAEPGAPQDVVIEVVIQ